MVVLGRCMRDRVLAKGVPAAKVHLIGVWGDREELQTTSSMRTATGSSGTSAIGSLVMYSGNFGIGHEIDTFLDAANSFRDDDRIRFAFVGGGKRRTRCRGLREGGRTREDLHHRGVPAP